MTLSIWLLKGPWWPWSYGSWIYNYLCKQCLSPLMLWVRISIRERCTTFRDKVCQWLAPGRRFSPVPPVSSTNKTDRHDIAEILLKVSLNTIKQTNKRKRNTVIHTVLSASVPRHSHGLLDIFMFGIEFINNIIG